MRKKFRKEPKKFQLDVVEIIATQPERVVGMFQPTGHGKTMAMEGCVMMLGGMTLFYAPTITLSEFQATRFQDDGFQIVNLEDIKTEDEKTIFLKYAAKIGKSRDLLRKQRCIVLCSPSSFAHPTLKWKKTFIRLARRGILKLVVIDECHLTPQHGRVFRQEEYKVFLELLHELKKQETMTPQILFASATMDKEAIEQLQDMCGLKITDRCHATPKEMARRRIRFHMYCRSAAHATRKVGELVSKRGFESETGAKTVVSTNTKAKVPKLRQYLRLSSIGTKGSDKFILGLDGDSPSLVKKTGISLFSGQIPVSESYLAPITNIMVISANVGSEGYDSSQIETVIHYGAPTSVAQLAQEAEDEEQKKKKQTPEQAKASQKIGLGYVWDSYKFAHCRECWHPRLENRYGHATSDADKSTEPCGNMCPYCSGELDENTVAVIKFELQQFVVSLFKERNEIEAFEFLDLLYPKDDNICRKLYGTTQKQIGGKFKVESLEVQMILNGILGLRDVEMDGKQVPCVFLEKEEVPPCSLVLYSENAWDDIRIRAPEE